MCIYKMMGSVRNLHIVLFIGLMCVVQTMAQVCPYSDPGCKNCSETLVICYKMSEIPPLNTGANVYPVKELQFLDGNISSIPKNRLPPGLETLIIKMHPLNNISEDAFEAVSATLNVIFFANARFDSLPKALLRLTNLTGLWIHYTGLTVNDTDLLKSLNPKINELSLRGVGLSSWPSFVSDFHVIRFLDLGFNSLTSIPNDALISNKDSLTQVYLHKNLLTQVAHAISILPNLEVLDLSVNTLSDVTELQQIAGSSFVEKLQDLRLASNGITRMANFSGFTKLKHIDLKQNEISDIPAGLLPLSLIELNLGDNQLSSVPTDIASMSKLSYLILLGNRITKIDPTSFPLSMEYIFISDNKINVISNSTFRTLKKLFRITMNNNPIKEIESAAFSDLPSLRALAIIGSQVTEFPLAITQLTANNSFLYFSSDKELICHCPKPENLTDWYKSQPLWKFKGNCLGGKLVSEYLSKPCQQASAST